MSDVVDNDNDDISIARNVKTPIFNIAFAASNSNAKSNPEIKILLIFFEFELDEDNRDLRLYLKK